MSHPFLGFAVAVLVTLACVSFAVAASIKFGGIPPGGIPYAGACDTITGGCPSAHSMSQKLVAAYGGNAFELINPTPAWTGTGSISGTTLTVASTSTGAMANGLALSAAGSGVTPGVAPVTYTSGCSGSTCTVSISQTAASVTSALFGPRCRLHRRRMEREHVADPSATASPAWSRRFSTRARADRRMI